MITPESTALAIGICTSAGIFAFKTAVGEYHFCAIHVSWKCRVLFLALTIGTYLLLFAAAFHLLDFFDLFRFAAERPEIVGSGTLLHLLLCAGLLVEGTRMLAARNEQPGRSRDSHGWLLLTIPCPICMSAILLACAMSKLLFPEVMPVLRWMLPIGFCGANLLLLLLLAAAGNAFNLRPLHLAGGMMIFMALYFIMILLVAPQFQEIDRLYSLAATSPERSTHSSAGAVTSALIAAALAAGFFSSLNWKKGN